MLVKIKLNGKKNMYMKHNLDLLIIAENRKSLNNQGNVSFYVGVILKKKLNIQAARSSLMLIYNDVV